jgi:hypothetical protein
MCGLPAACGEKPAGRRRKVRPLCQAHADAIFGAQDPPWRQLDARTQRDIVEERLRGMTILAHGDGRPPEELLSEIATVNDTDAHMIRLVSPLMPGEARDLQQSIRAQNRLRSRETMVHAIVTQILLDWYANASGQTRGEVIERLALKLDALLDQSGPPPAQPGGGSA